jgi:hypothetical protein
MLMVVPLAVMMGTIAPGHLVHIIPSFMPKPSTHHMHDPGSNVPHIRTKSVHT